jgi:hypothetical protein
LHEAALIASCHVMRIAMDACICFYWISEAMHPLLGLFCIVWMVVVAVLNW